MSTPSTPPAKRLAIYPGTFDPVHNGHVDIARRAALLFDELIVAVYDRPAKSLLFSPEERIKLARQSIGDGSPHGRIIVEGYSGLTVKYARKRGACAIVRGLRAVSDFDYEYQMTIMNRHLESDIETLFLMTSLRFAYLSSSRLKEVASGGAEIDDLVPSSVAAALRERYERAHS
ncbi:MAG: pantetheine-phosphate adenylyltransferase [Chloroflexi bacterium]|nr:pantetheine-phosphate adenylyltransferase [Chloroflexota bacterium]